MYDRPFFSREDAIRSFSLMIPPRVTVKVIVLPRPIVPPTRVPARKASCLCDLPSSAETASFAASSSVIRVLTVATLPERTARSERAWRDARERTSFFACFGADVCGCATGRVAGTTAAGGVVVAEGVAPAGGLAGGAGETTITGGAGGGEGTMLNANAATGPAFPAGSTAIAWIVWDEVICSCPVNTGLAAVGTVPSTV